MTLQSFPLIAVDFSGNEHSLEWRGHSQGDAAERMLRQHSNFRSALNGKQGGTNNPYRKLVRTQHGVEADATETTLGQALLEAQSAQSLQAGRMILSALRKKGLRLDTIEENGIEKIVVTPKGVITPEERAEIDENQASILVLLRNQDAEQAIKEEAARGASPVTMPKESQRDIVRKMIPELPDSFIRYDLEQALHRWEYHDLADKSPKLDSLLAWCATEGLIERTGKGHYRRIALPARIADSASLPAMEPSQFPQESGLGPQEPSLLGSITEADTALTATRVEELQNVSQPMPMETASRPGRAVPVSFAQALVDLTSELAALPIDESKLDEIEDGFKQLFECLEKVMDPVDALIKQLRANARARDRLRTHLAAEAESNT